MRDMSYALKKCDKIIAKAFFELAKGQREATEGEIPIMIYNPHPYEVRDVFKVGFMLQNQNWNEDEITVASVYDEEDKPVLCQDEKAEATFNLDWVKSTAFCGVLKPCSMNRFNVRLKVTKKTETKKNCGEKICLSANGSQLVIDRRNGLIEKYCVNGALKIKNSGALEVYRDNEDPWGMTVSGFSDKEGEFRLLSNEETGEFLGYDCGTENVVISEDGDVRTKIDAFFGYKKSYAVIEYIFNKVSGELDVKITLYSADANRCIKYRLDTGISGGSFYGQTAFGAEEQASDGSETVFQKWCGIKNENEGLYVINKSTYGGSFKDLSMYLTLLRTPVYSAHPICERQIAPHDRYLQHIDMGERSFEFKITAASDYEKKALYFNEEPIALSYFPHREERDNSPCMIIDNENIIMSLIKKEDEKIVMHLFNSSDKQQKSKISGLFFDENEITFKGYELKLFEITDKRLVEVEKYM